MLRANGGNIEFIGFNPFVVSLSNHSNDFFNSLLKKMDSGPAGMTSKKPNFYETIILMLCRYRFKATL